ncbi:hypothetical protein ACOSQ2_025183 [Xanthoceras sorbifolium]
MWVRCRFRIRTVIMKCDRMVTPGPNHYWKFDESYKSSVRSQGRNNFKGDSAESGRGKENINPNSTVNRGVGDEGLTKLTPYVADSVKGKENSTSASETPSSTKKAVVAQDTDLKQELSFKENLGEKRFNRYFLIMARKGKKGCSSIHKIDCGIERSFDEVVKDNFVAAMGSFIFSVMLNVKKSDLSSRVTPSTHVFSGELEAQFSAAGSVLVGEESAKIRFGSQSVAYFGNF